MAGMCLVKVDNKLSKRVFCCFFSKVKNKKDKQNNDIMPKTQLLSKYLVFAPEHLPSLRFTVN